MKTWQKILFYAGIVLSIILIVICVAIVIGYRGTQKTTGSISSSNLGYPAGQDPQKAGECLDDYMKSVVPSSPLIGYGQTFATAGQSNNVNPALMVAIGQQESALGTAGIVNSHPYNFFGMTAAGGGFRSFSSWDEAINFQANYLKTEYMDQGLTTIPQIGGKYCPVGAANDPTGLNNNWVSGVTNHFNNIVSHCPDLGSMPSGAGNGSIVAVAQSQLGTSESYDSCNCGAVQKYGGRAGDPYCAFFASWVYRQAGYNIPSIGGAGALYEWFGSHQTQIPKGSGPPQPGDVIYFSFSHVGIVESFDGSVVHTIEGNTSTNNVARRSRNINSGDIVGFGRWKTN